ncbi:hypothetical protein ACQKMD_15330 [Viridibacillus sp. NPDC096237]|uniref:hypothetical protein n=1 Tax=Viridibacillus sp. NPDC096237 TaxID=3390721 RepID=UPI003D030E99
MKLLKTPYSYLCLSLVALFGIIVNYQTTWALVLLIISFLGSLFLMFLDRNKFKKNEN